MVNLNAPTSRLPATLLVLAIWLAITLLGGRLASDGKPHPLLDGVSHGIAWNIAAAALFVLAAAYALGWRDLKFVAPRPWRSLRILWLPALYLLLFGAASLILGPVPGQTMLFLFVNTMIVGLSEESMFRGVLFQGLRTHLPMWPAIILTSLMFGSVHIFNVFGTGEFWPAILQALAAAMSGVLFMAILIRTGSIWPGIIFHGLWDFGTFMLSAHVAGAPPAAQASPNLAMPLLLVAPGFLYGLFLLRHVRNDAPPPAGEADSARAAA